MLIRTAIVAWAALLWTGAAGCKSSTEPVTVFVAASVARAMGEVGEVLTEEHPKLEVRLEISGSQVACRKVSELKRRADLVVSADLNILRRLLVPAWAPTATVLATNSVVLAHMEHSRHTGEITTDNWQEILQRPKVRLGLVDPNLAPIGYRTLLVWQLAGMAKGARDLATRLRARIPASQIVPHEGELLGRLQARAIDYAFVYRSTAEDHNLKLVPLGDGLDLGSMAMAARYAGASLKVRVRSSEVPATVRGAPILYGVAIPKNAPNRPGANLLLATLLGEPGARVLARRGFTPLASKDAP